MQDQTGISNPRIHHLPMILLGRPLLGVYWDNTVGLLDVSFSQLSARTQGMHEEGCILD